MPSSFLLTGSGFVQISQENARFVYYQLSVERKQMKIWKSTVYKILLREATGENRWITLFIW